MPAGSTVGASAGAATADFATVLHGYQADPEGMATVTLGEMLSTAPGSVVPATVPLAPTLVGGVSAAAPAVGVGVVDAPNGTTSAMVWPVQGGRTTSEFGPRVHPVTGAHRDHHGLDIAAPTGTPIVAASAGRVTFAGSQGGYGNVVIIDHGGGIETRYAHQDRINVSVGDQVFAGQRIGAVGSTGLSTGPHLHFEVRRDGEPVDPRTRLTRA